MEALVLGLVNLPHLIDRIERAGVDQEPLALALAHLLAYVLLQANVEMVVELLRDPWRHAGPVDLDAEARDVLRRAVIEPIVSKVLEHFGTACMQDCERLAGELEPERPLGPEHRWLELLPTAVSRDDAKPSPYGLLIEQENAPCRAGLKLSRDYRCPFSVGLERDWEQLFGDPADGHHEPVGRCRARAV